MSRDRLLAIALVVLGLAQMAFDLAGFVPGKALAAATLASPAPKVFTAVGSYETFSPEFRIVWEAGALALDPELGAALEGPYNRRNVYGAAIAYAPVLEAGDATRPMFRAVLAHALCRDAPLLREIGVADEIVDPRLEVVEDGRTRTFRPECP